MARTVSVSFSDGFIGDDNGKNNVAIHTQLLSGLGWSNLQFTQQSTTGQFTLQGNDLIGTILVTDAAGVEHALAATMNWRTPSGAVTTPVFYLTASPGSPPEVLATKTGSITIDPFDKSVNGDPHSFIGLTFNGKTLDVSSGTVTGNAAAASTMLKELNDYLLSQPQLSIGSVTVDEGGLFASVTVTLANAPSSASGISVGFHTADGTATAGSDYVAQSDTLYFAQGETSKTIKIALLNDTAVENTESFNIILSDSRMAAIVNDTGIVTITDNDSASPPPVAPAVVSVVAEDALHPGLSPRDASVVEGGKLQYTVSLSAGSGGQLELPVAVGGSATAGDYGSFEFSAGVGWKNGAADSGILVVPANVTSFVITIPTVDNSIVDGPRTLDLTVGGKTGSGEIADDDLSSVPATVSVASLTVQNAALPGSTSVDEGGLLVYTVALSGTTSTTTEFSFLVGGSVVAADIASPLVFSDGVAWKSGSSDTVVVPAGVGGFTVKVATVDDSLVEATETLRLTVGGKSAEGSILDNDSRAIDAVTLVQSSVTEGTDLVYGITLKGGAAVATEHVIALEGSASAADYGALSFSDGVTWKNNDATTLTLVVPASVSTFTVTVPTADDSLVEATETLRLTVGGKSVEGSILDNDSRAIDAVTLVQSSVTEGTDLVYGITLKGGAAVATEHVIALDGSASAADYGALSFSDGVTWKNNDATTLTLVVPASVSTFTVTVPTADDSLVEAAETLRLTVGGKSAEGSILDNDSRAIDAVTLVQSSVTEGVDLVYGITLKGGAAVATEHVIALDGSASAADYGALSFSDGVTWKNNDATTLTLVVPASVSSFTVTVPTADDSLVEAAETLRLTVGGKSAEGSILDNDSRAIDAVTLVQSSVTEGVDLVYGITLKGGAAVATEHVIALDGSASAADYGALSFSDGVTWKNNDATTLTLVVPASVSSFTVTVPTADDSLVEAAETLRLTVGGKSAEGSILDNDSRAIDAVTLVQSSVTEGVDLVYGITLKGGVAVATEHVIALDGSASAADYGALSFSDGVTWKNNDATTLTLVVPASVSSFTVTVPTADDSLVEATETLRLTVGGKSAEGSILDNASRAIDAVTLVQSSVTEGTDLVYGITLKGGAAVATEHVIALDGSASAADYGALSFSDGVTWKNNDATTLTLVVPASVSTFTVTVPTADDSLVEAAETLRLTVGGKSAEGSILDNDSAPPVPPTPPVPTTPAEPTPPITAPPQIGLDPKSDDGVSNTDHVTSEIAPNFNISGAGAYLRDGGSVRLLDPSGAVVGASAIGAAEVASGKVDVRAIPLDDGQYTFMTQILDADGKVLVEAPVTVTIVTDVDGIQPSVELAANGGDFNGDGILDWQQHTVAQLPLSSLADYQAGKNAPASSFGAILAGAPSAVDPGGSVLLTGGAQLKDISITAAPTDLPSSMTAASPVFNFSLTAETPDAPLPDIDSTRAGLQTRVVIDLAPGGIVANDYLKFDAATGTWFSFLDDQRLDTMDDGATLVDLDGDGRIDRVVLTFTDGARGDDDGVANGTIVDPGLLAQVSAPAAPPATPDTPAAPAQPAPAAAPPVYTILLANGDRYYTADATEAARVATGVDNRLEGAQFTSASPTEGGRHVGAYYQPFTDDWHFGVDGSPMPYACYAPVAGTAGFFAFAAGSGNGEIFHLYQNVLGQTQVATAAQAAGLGLSAAGFSDHGAAFNASTQDAFAFDAEGFLIGNRDNASVQELVRSLAARFSSTADKGFVEAVEQAYLGMAQIVGVAHGGQASAADLNALFGTHFA